MLQSLRNRRNRKGFTLAELLIVVAIIAVLVAIAVPLFVSGLNNAQNATFEANKRAVKSAAAVKILADNNGTSAVSIDTMFATGNHVAATAVVAANGDISSLTITYGQKEVAETADYAAWKASTNGNKITVELKLTDLTTATISPAGT